MMASTNTVQLAGSSHYPCWTTQSPQGPKKGQLQYNAGGAINQSHGLARLSPMAAAHSSLRKLLLLLATFTLSLP